MISFYQFLITVFFTLSFPLIANAQPTEPIQISQLVENHLRKQASPYHLINYNIKVNNLMQEFVEQNPTLFNSTHDNEEKAFDSNFTSIFLTCSLTILVYSIIHHQITARSCIEYYNSDAMPHNKRILDLIPFISYDNASLVGSIEAISKAVYPLAVGPLSLSLAARLGKKPKLHLKDFWVPLLSGIGLTTIASTIAWIVGFYSCNSTMQALGTNRSQYIPAEKQALFSANDYAQSAAFSVGFASILGIITWVLLKRGIIRQEPNETVKKNVAQFLYELENSISLDQEEHVRGEVVKFIRSLQNYARTPKIVEQIKQANQKK